MAAYRHRRFIEIHHTSTVHALAAPRLASNADGHVTTYRADPALDHHSGKRLRAGRRRPVPAWTSPAGA